MYSVNVRDHFMIAHSFEGEAFGPAQQLHGATYVVDATFSRSDLDSSGMVVDIGLAGEQLKRILGDLYFRNLDEDPNFAGKNTTTEFLARDIFDRLVQDIRSGRFGETGRAGTTVSVALSASHVAWGPFDRSV